MTAMRAPADRRELIIPFVRDYTLARGYAPTIREIRDACGFRSTYTVNYHLGRLRARGLVDWNDGQSRTLHVPRGRAVRVLDIEDVVAGRA